MAEKGTQTIHPIIKSRLGYDETISDHEFLKKWKRRASQVCKPCWELKYCPYGPFVEQSPVVPPTRSEAEEHNEYLKQCLATGLLGTIRELDAEDRERYAKVIEAAKADPSVLADVVAQALRMRKWMADAEKEGKTFWEVFASPVSEFEKYQVPCPLDEKEKPNSRIAMTPAIEAGVNQEIQAIERALSSGVKDDRRPLEELRRKMFQAEVDSFDPKDYPEHIPQAIKDMACAIFGHICPVVFVGESITETTVQRRKGRDIPDKTKLRVVRRDNYTCQLCGKHLKDDELEFDHIIPISRGGSSEEHNIRLTCFGCNRNKSDRVEI